MTKSDPTLEFEEALWQQGFFCVCGIDEAGRGAWAGPVTAGAVVLPSDPTVIERLSGVRDSKLMKPSERESLFEHIRETAETSFVGEASHEEIDRIGILNATKLAMCRAIEGLSITPQHLLIDYVVLNGTKIPQKSIKHGDMLSLSIACASILAKVTRDRWMSETAATLYPQYGFEHHKGYGTALHQEKLAEFGPCPIHRMSFRPLNPEPRLFN